ncbi:hypothetical protein CR513_04544, partial [Mucuna pruriens]
MVQLMGKMMPKGNRMVTNLYYVMKLVQILGLGCLQIDCCPNGCLLYFIENSDKTVIKCFVCKTNQYMSITKRGFHMNISIKKMWYFPLIPRLKLLYSSIITTSHMRWNSENERDPTLLCHPSDEFSEDPRNARLGLCANGFNPFGQYEKSYSCGSVILTLYNLPLRMCMKREFMFLTVLIPGPSNPKHKIDVYL